MTHFKEIFRNKLEDLFAIDFRSLALLRMGMGLLIIVDLLMRSADLREHYTDLGIFPRAAAWEFFAHRGLWSIHVINGSVLFEGILFFLAGFFALALIVGYRTRLVTFVSWALLVSLHARNYLILISADLLLRMLLFWSIFLPLGERWSVDSILHPEKRSSQKRICSMASGALLFQVALMYFVAGFSKVNAVWNSGQALLYIFSLDTFGGGMGRYLLHWPGFVKEISKVVPWFEMSGAVLSFLPIFTKQLRVVLVVVFILFHAVVELCMKNLGIFSYVSMLAWIAFVPTFFWDRIWRENLQPGISVTSQVPEDVKIWNNRIIHGLVSFFLIYTLILNLEDVQWIKQRKKNFKIIPPFMRWIGSSAFLQQKWHMFNFPPKENIWYIIAARLKDGTSVDIYSGQEPVFSEESKIPAQKHIIKNYRWEKFYSNLLTPERSKYWKYLLDYDCHQWNISHLESKKIEFATVYRIGQSAFPISKNIPYIRPFFKKDYSDAEGKKNK